MKTWGGAWLGLLAVGSLWAGGAPPLQPGFPVRDGSVNLSFGSFSVVTVIDWDQDGRKDLLVHDSSCGQIQVYLNQGTDSVPVFSGGTVLESDGAPIVTSYG